MTENIPGESKESFGNLRRQYDPRREIAEKLLDESGLDPKSSEYKKARAKFARELLRRDTEARTDELTGAFSRAEFMRRLEEETLRQKRHGHKSSLVFLDVNDLKVVNDKDVEGGHHAAGDEILRKVVRFLQERGRKTDSVGRYGGDEFVVLLPESDLDGVSVYWKRINEDFQKNGIKISAGAAEIDLNDPLFSLKTADELMYEAKRVSKITGENMLIMQKQPVQ